MSDIVNQSSFKKYRKRRLSFQSMKIPRSAAGKLELSVRGAQTNIRGRGKSYSRERPDKRRRGSSFGRGQRDTKYLVPIDYAESVLSSS